MANRALAVRRYRAWLSYRQRGRAIGGYTNGNTTAMWGIRARRSPPFGSRRGRVGSIPLSRKRRSHPQV
jgi:hypothetical protein